MTKHPELFLMLTAPFDPSEVKIRSQNSRQLHYVTARTVMNRLDSVLGPENWWDRYVPGEHSVLCELTIRLSDGSSLTKADAGGYAGMADQGDDDKSGYSDAFKRAAVKFGVGRYLYRDGVPTYAQGAELTPAEAAAIRPAGADPQAGPSPGGRRDPGAPPQGRGEAYEEDLPPDGQDARGHQGAGRNGNGNGNGHGGPPRSGKALFAFCKEMEQKHQVGLLKYLNGYMRLQEFPTRMVDLDAEQVGLVYREAMRKLSTLEGAA
jgi:hypothetical protein